LLSASFFSVFFLRKANEQIIAVAIPTTAKTKIIFVAVTKDETLGFGVHSRHSKFCKYLHAIKSCHLSKLSGVIAHTTGEETKNKNIPALFTQGAFGTHVPSVAVAASRNTETTTSVASVW
jgi:hypothetical protein